MNLDYYVARVRDPRSELIGRGIRRATRRRALRHSESCRLGKVVVGDRGCDRHLAHRHGDFLTSYLVAVRGDDFDIMDSRNRAVETFSVDSNDKRTNWANESTSSLRIK